MADTFDRSTWKSNMAAWWRETAGDLPGTMRRLGVSTAYGLLAAGAWLPLLEAYARAPGTAVTALVGIAGGVGSNLVANLVQGTYDKATAPQQVEREVAERPAVRAEYQQILAGLDVLAVAQQALGDQWAAFEERLRPELARMGGELRIESGGGAVILGNVTVQHGDFIGRDQNIHIHPPAPAPDATPLRQAYLRHLADRYGWLPLRGVDLRAGDATARAERPRLAHVYVDLDTTTWREVKPRPHTKPDMELATPDGERMLVEVKGEAPSPLRALEAMVERRRLVLLGAPGSGKSTFVGYLTFCLAMAQLEPEGDWLAHLPGWPPAEAETLPIVVTLRDFARWAAGRELAHGSARALDEFIAAWLAEYALADFAAPLREALRQGKAVVLLDGLDEVPTRELRALVRDAVAGFARTYQPSRVLVTCRTLSYQEPAWQLDPQAFPAFELAPFDADKINRFIGAWYEELAALKAVPPEDAERLAGRLRGAVRRPDLWRLAPNPLLLTVMALVHTHKGRLPESRALLYEECTDLLLWRWEQVKWQAEGEQAPDRRRLLAGAGLQDVDLKRALWELAFEVHATAGNREDGEATADIAEVRLLRALRELHPARSWDWAAAVVTQIKERAGLLLEREPEVYTFPHRTFQEYLAGCHLSVQADFPERAAKLLGEAAIWREVVLLAVGRQVHIAGDVARPLALAAELCPAQAPADDEGWRMAWLAGDVLLETGPERAARSGLGRELLDRVQARLAALVSEGRLAPRERAEAGEVLGQLRSPAQQRGAGGDPRPGVGIISLPLPAGEARPGSARAGGPGMRVLPDIVWVEVPAGPFRMGSRPDDRETLNNEKPQHTVEIPYRYWMARYPATVAQYACFLEAEGYARPDWWPAAGWAWRQGEWDSQVKDEYTRDWLSRRPAALRAAPMGWDDQQEHPNRPVMGVTWFEVSAFGRWLTGQFRLLGPQAPWPLPGGYEVRLPTEAEWEKAARGEDARLYPWGNEDWEPGRANVQMSIGNPTPVGMYPGGKTPSGLLDLAGNVWEWTRSLYRPYPYRADDGREDSGADGARVLRGGSWLRDQWRARCAFRDRLIPDFFDDYVGFRLVASPAQRP
jgi:formylglycine-generating enzyme required for sulfatase activity